ncbi:hypothetical protein EYR36_001453 [Pleurotus pulmonarius]|nr:hypothetical protein EYR36_001453 [Pleurotus pulmonarius]
MKVHALYSERRKTLYMLHLFRTISFFLITYTTVATLLVLSYDGACIVSDIPQQVTWFGALAIFSQLIVTFLGMSPSVLKEILRQSSLIATMSRDSFFMFGIVTIFSAIIIRYAALMAHVIPQFFLSTLSVIGCRMILNTLETASREGDTIRTASVHLSMLLDSSFASAETCDQMSSWLNSVAKAQNCRSQVARYVSKSGSRLPQPACRSLSSRSGPAPSGPTLSASTPPGLRAGRTTNSFDMRIGSNGLGWSLRRREFHSSCAKLHGHLKRPEPGTGIKVTFKDSKGELIKTVEANDGDDLLSLAHEHDIDLEGACERSCACSTCHVILPQELYDILPEPEDDENDMLDMAFGLTDTSRLGCQVYVTKEMKEMGERGEIVATLPSATRNMFVDDGFSLAIFMLRRQSLQDKGARAKYLPSYRKYYMPPNMTVSPAGTKAGSDRGGVVNEVPSGKPLELPNVNVNNMPPSTARKSSTGGSHDCDTRSSYLNPSQKSSTPSPERSSLRRFSLLPQPVEPRPSSHPGTPAPGKAKEPLTADEHWNLAHAFAFTPRFSRLGLNGEGVILPIHAKDFRGARRNTMKSNENRNPVSGETRSVRQSIPPRPSSAPPSAPPVATVPPTTGSSPRKPRPNKLRKSRPPSLSRPATPRNPLAPQTNADPKAPVKRATSEKVNKSQVKPRGDSVQRSQSLNVSGTSRRPMPNPNQRHRSYSGTSTPVKNKEPLTADEHWNLAHAFAFTPRFSRLGLEAEGVIMPIHAKDFRRTRRNTVANGHPSRSVRQPTTSRPQPTPQPVATPITAVPSPAPSPARRPRPNKLRKSRPPSLASSAPSRKSSILLPNADAKDTVKGATETLNKEVTEPEVTRGEPQTEEDTQDYVIQNSASCPSIRVFSVDDRRDSVVSSDGASSYFTTPSGSSSLFQSSSRSSSSSVLEFTTRTPDSLAVEEVVVVPSDELSINTLTPPRTPDSLAVEEDVALSSDAPAAPPPCERPPSPPASLSSVRLLASPAYPSRAFPQRDSVPPSPLFDLPSLRSLPSIPGVNDTLDAEKKVTPQADANKTGLMRRFTLRLKSLKRNNAAREKVRPNQGLEQSDRKVDQESPEAPAVARPPSSRKLRKRRRPTPSVLAH